MPLTLDQQADLASLAYELGHNPKTRSELAHLVNKVNPARARASFPDVVQEERFKTLQRKVEDLVDVNGARAAKARLDAQKAGLKERYSDEEIGKIEQVMDRFGTHDYEAGAVLYAHQNGGGDPRDMPPDPADRPGATWEFPTVSGRDGKALDF